MLVGTGEMLYRLVHQSIGFWGKLYSSDNLESSSPFLIFYFNFFFPKESKNTPRTWGEVMHCRQRENELTFVVLCIKQLC